MSRDSVFKELVEVKQELKQLSLERKTDIPAYKLLQEREEALEYQMIDVKRGIYIGIGVEIGELNKRLEPIYLQWSHLTHSIIYGITRVGKTRLISLMLRQYLLAGHNVILIDPKGAKHHELIAWAMSALLEGDRERDYMYVNPSYKDSLCFNPLYGLNNEAVASMVVGLAHDGSSDEFFKSVSYKVVMAILLGLEYLEVISDPTGEGKTYKLEKETMRFINNYYFKNSSDELFTDESNKVILQDIAGHLQGEGIKKSNKSEAILMAMDRTFITYKSLSHYANFTHLKALYTMVKTLKADKITEQTQRLYTEAVSNLVAIVEGGEDYYTKTTGSLTQFLSQMSSGRIGHLLCSNKINPFLNRLMDKRSKTGLCLYIQPSPLQYKVASDNLVKSVFKIIEFLIGLMGDVGRGLKESIVIVDEASEAIYKGSERIFNKSAGFGLKILAATQSKADFESKIGEDLSKVINDNINTKIYFRMDDNASAHLVSSEIGSARKIDSITQASSDGSRVGFSIRDENMVLPQDVTSLQKGKAIVRYAGKNYLVSIAHVKDPPVILTTDESAFESDSGMMNDLERSMV